MWARPVAPVLVLAIAIAIVLALAVPTLLSRAGQPSGRILRVVSGSMRPTIAVGQLVQVDTAAYASAEPRVGDIVAFHAPAGATGETPVCGVLGPSGAVCAQATAAASNEIFVKRVVGEPGDLIAVLGGSVLRDGALERAPFSTPCHDAACNFPVSIRVPAGELFLMGDDRAMSDDSRYWGPVPTSWIIGKVVS